MLNITPDTRFQWAGGCWCAVPSAPQIAKTNVGMNQLSPTPRAASTERPTEIARETSPRANASTEHLHANARAA